MKHLPLRRRAAALPALLAAVLFAAGPATAQAQSADPGGSAALHLLQSAARGAELKDPGLIEMLLALHARLDRLAHGGADVGLFMPSSGRIAAELAGYRTRLRITGTQLPLWNGFVDAVQDAADTLRRAIEASRQDSAPKPLLGLEFAAVRSLAATGGPLYASLSEAQKDTVQRLVTQGLRGLRGGQP
jgi:hypothetical protein